jgi:hypothetical protein
MGKCLVQIVLIVLEGEILAVLELNSDSIQILVISEFV